MKVTILAPDVRIMSMLIKYCNWNMIFLCSTSCTPAISWTKLTIVSIFSLICLYFSHHDEHLYPNTSNKRGNTIIFSTYYFLISRIRSHQCNLCFQEIHLYNMCYSKSGLSWNYNSIHYTCIIIVWIILIFHWQNWYCGCWMVGTTLWHPQHSVSDIKGLAYSFEMR